MVSERPCRILYVDDEPGLLELGKVFLEQTAGMNVETSTDAHEALKRLSEESFDAVVSDYQMPNMDGIQFLEALRSSGDDVPFIIFTGKGREDVVINAFKSGADFYLQKGGNPRAQFAELVNMIQISIKKKNSEHKLHESERKLRSIIDGMDQGMVVISREGKVLSFNEKAMKIMGFKDAESMNKLEVFKFQAFRNIDEKHKESLKNGFNTTMNLGQGSMQRFPIQRLDGQMGWAEGYSTQLDYDGEQAVLILFRDITNEIEMEQLCRLSEARYRSIVEVQQEMVCRFTPEMIIIYANQSFYRTFKTMESEILGVNVTELIPLEDQIRFRKYMAAITPTNSNCLFKHNVILDDGSKLCVEWDYHGIFDYEGILIEYQAVGRIKQDESDECGC